jgi:hypothetical protein
MRCVDSLPNALVYECSVSVSGLLHCLSNAGDGPGTPLPCMRTAHCLPRAACAYEHQGAFSRNRALGRTNNPGSMECTSCTCGPQSGHLIAGSNFAAVRDKAVSLSLAPITPEVAPSAQCWRRFGASSLAAMPPVTTRANSVVKSGDSSATNSTQGAKLVATLKNAHAGGER